MAHLDEARERRSAAYWRRAILENADLRRLRNGLLSIGEGYASDDADKVLAQIMADFRMPPDLLPVIVGMLGSASRFGANETVLFLYQLAAVARTDPGRRLIRSLATAMTDAGEENVDK